MKKKFVCVLMLVMGITFSYAQMAQWKIRPAYDTMYIPEGAPKLIRADSSGYTVFWNLKGERIERIEGVVHAFHNDVAVVTTANKMDLWGFVSASGEYVQVKSGKYKVARSFPQLSDGYLLVEETGSGVYRYIDKKGDPINRRYYKAYPFLNGFAACQYEDNPEKPKKKYYGLLNKEGSLVPFSYSGKQFKESDLNYVSSVNDENIAVVVAKSKVYLYLAKSKILRPVCSTEGDSDGLNTKLQAVFSGDPVNKRIEAKCINGRYVNLFFDEFDRLISIKYTDGKEKKYIYNNKEKRRLKTDLDVTSGVGGFGLSKDSVELLAPQFERIPSCFDDKAIVCRNGKYGMIQLFPNKKFEVKIHKEEGVPFVHRKFKTNIEVQFPLIPADSVSLIIDSMSKYGVDIDKFSLKPMDLRDLHNIKYDCELSIPQILFEQDSAMVEYPAQINYEGFFSPVIFVKKLVTFRKYWSVKANEKYDLNSDEGVLSFGFELGYSNKNEQSPQYSPRVSIAPDTTGKEIGKVESHSETSYTCTVWSLQEGKNRIEIIVDEDGFPGTSHPIEFYYQPKKEATEDEPVAKEAAIISFEQKEAIPVRKKSKKSAVKQNQEKKYNMNLD